jgi:hypothetical protein
MSDLGPSPRGSTTPRSGPTFLSGCFCATCPFRFVCAAADTVEACGDPSEYTARVHPRTTPLDATEPTALPRFTSRAAMPVFDEVLLVADRTRGGAVRGVRLLNTLASLNRKPGSSPSHPGAIAVLLGVDQRLDRVWRRRRLLGAALVADDFAAAISPGFSTWRSDSPFASRIAMLQSALMAVELGRHLPTVPTIVWRYWNDLDQWAAWIANNRIRTIAVENGSVRNDDEWLAAIDGVRYLGEALVRRPYPLPRLLMSGPSTRQRITLAAAAWEGPLTIVSQTPWQLAGRRIALGPDLDTEPAADCETKAGLLTENVASFTHAARAAMRGIRRSGAQIVA